LVVLGNAVGARSAAGLNHTAAGGDGEIGDEGIFGFAGAMRNDLRVTGAAREINSIKCLRQRTNLIDLDQNRIGDKARSSQLDIRHKISSPRFELSSQLALAASSRPNLLWPGHPQWDH
jgi:hypothetical protein